jgi:hypothetical protein
VREFRGGHVAVEEVLSGLLAAHVQRLVEVERLASEHAEVGLERVAVRTVLGEHLRRPLQQRTEERGARLAQRLAHTLVESLDEVVAFKKSGALPVVEQSSISSRTSASSSALSSCSSILSIVRPTYQRTVVVAPRASSAAEARA